MMARLLVGLATVAVLGWFGYWWVGSSAQETALKTWLADRATAGWVADYDTLKVQGFPNRFDTTVTDLHLADPQQGWAWSAPAFYINALSYQLNHIIVVWPEMQKFSTPHETLTLLSENMRASVKFEPNTALALDKTTVEMDGMTLSSTAGWSSTLKKARFSTRQTAGEKFSHDLDFHAQRVKPAQLFKNVVDPGNILPAVFEEMHIGTTLAFDAPWDRLAIEGRKPVLERIDLTDVSAKWGELSFQAIGSVTLDTLGYPTGNIRIRAQNWRDMLKLAVNSGRVPADLVGPIETALTFLARMSGNPDTIDAPLSFSGKTMSLGIIPIGPSPRFRL